MFWRSLIQISSRNRIILTKILYGVPKFCSGKCREIYSKWTTTSSSLHYWLSYNFLVDAVWPKQFTSQSVIKQNLNHLPFLLFFLFYLYELLVLLCYMSSSCMPSSPVNKLYGLKMIGGTHGTQSETKAACTENHADQHCVYRIQKIEEETHVKYPAFDY